MVSVLVFTSVAIFAVGYFPTGMMKLRTERGVTISVKEKTISNIMHKTATILGLTILFAGTIYANWGW